MNETMSRSRRQRERELNHRLRSTLAVTFGSVETTPSFSTVDRETREAILTAVASWQFAPDDDSLRDEGHFVYDEIGYFWQVLCFKRNSICNEPSPKPWSDRKTYRVLVIGTEWEYGNVYEGPR